MKRILFIVALLPFLVKAQSINNQKVRWMQPIYMGSNTPAALNASADTSTFFFNAADSLLYFKYKGAARAIGYAGASTVDSSVYSTRAWRQKGVDSVSANLVAGLALKLNITDTSSMLSPYYRTALANATIVQRITDSLRSLVRLRASGSGGIQLQNSNGTNVADFGIANTTNGSIAGGWNVGGNSTISGTLGVTQKATFSDSIVGVNQRLSGNISAATFNGSALGSYAYRSSGLAELSGAAFTGFSTFRDAANTYSIHISGNALSNGVAIGTISGNFAAIQGYTNNFSATNNISLQPVGGNVGIGTTSPSRLLHLSSTGDTYLRVDGQGFESLFGSDANGTVINQTGLTGISFRTTNSDRMRITAGGRILMGTTSDNGTDRLQVSGSASVTGNIQAATFNGSALGSYAYRSSGLAELNGATFTGGVNVTADAGNEQFRISRASNNNQQLILGYHSSGYATIQSILQGTSATPLILNPIGGNVGIGTTSPSELLHVSGTGRFNGYVSFNNQGYIRGGTNTLDLQGGTTGTYFYNSSYSSVRMVVLDGGNVGIGTTNPTNTLSVNGTLGVTGALTATAQGNNITIGVDSSVTSTSYTLVLGDAGYLKRCSNASAITITVPTNASVAFPIGTTIYISQQGAGKVSVSPATSDVTIQSEGSLLGTAGQHAVIGLIKVNTNRWLLVGNRG